MNHTSLNGRRLFVGEAKPRSDIKTHEVYENKSNGSGNLDRTVTWSYGKKEWDENRIFMSKEVVVESDGVMEQCDTLAVNKSVCSSGVGVVDVLKQGSHGNGLEGKEKEANLMERSSNLDMGVRLSIPIVQIGPGVSDDEEDFHVWFKGA
ncbi:hypothetical protein PIB30_003907 [Stylosanthes scabra]|uniref:Uncharacterized protein n=1 Tax=Stylosanthes scabra TaxID=79078 RepID=A0ABU6U665_9FABA|nr:hypothetical protein [Stylosanthes scabra]